MYRLYYQPENHWFGDCMPFGKDGKFYLYHQRDTRKPGPFGEPFGWALAVTEDFVHYEDFGESLLRGKDDEQDQFIFAGSIFEAQGKYHAMYTGYNRAYLKQGKNPQVLMKATSDDLIHWQKNDEKLVAPQPGYDPADWRDPFVLWNEDTQEYMMILGGRKAGARVNRGCTVLFTSKDLHSWDFKGDFWAPDLYSMHEMPDLFKIGDWWYLIISEYSEKNKMVYRRSKSLSGPWLAPVDDAFDGRAYYAGRTACDGSRRILFGWVPTRETWNDAASWTWGGTFVPYELYQRADGSLGCKIPDSVLAAFAPAQIAARDLSIQTVDSSSETVLATIPDKFMKFEATIRFTPGTRAFGVRLYEDPETGDAYDFRILLGENRMVFDKVPMNPANKLDNRGLERPITLEPDREYLMQLIIDDDIATIYLDGVAMNVRMYNCQGDKVSLYVTDGTLFVREASTSTEIRK